MTTSSKTALLTIGVMAVVAWMFVDLGTEQDPGTAIVPDGTELDRPLTSVPNSPVQPIDEVGLIPESGEEADGLETEGSGEVESPDDSLVVEKFPATSTTVDPEPAIETSLIPPQKKASTKKGWPKPEGDRKVELVKLWSFRAKEATLVYDDRARELLVQLRKLGISVYSVHGDLKREIELDSGWRLQLAGRFRSESNDFGSEEPKELLLWRRPEMVAVTSSEGELLWTKKLRRPSAIRSGDIDKNGLDEILSIEGNENGDLLVFDAQGHEFWSLKSLDPDIADVIGIPASTDGALEFAAFQKNGGVALGNRAGVRSRFSGLPDLRGYSSEQSKSLHTFLLDGKIDPALLLLSYAHSSSEIEGGATLLATSISGEPIWKIEGGLLGSESDAIRSSYHFVSDNTPHWAVKPFLVV